MVVSKQRNFEETKRTPHYGLRKLNVGVASVLLGVTVFGINVALDPAKAAADATTQTQTASQTSLKSGANASEAVSTATPEENTTPNTKTTAAAPTPAASTVGSDRNAAGSVDENNINTQTQAKNNQLAKETGLTSSDNSSSNIYKEIGRASCRERV